MSDLIDQWCSGCGAQLHEGEALHKRYDPGHSDYREPEAVPVSEGLDVERLARAIEAAGCTPSCSGCGADIAMHTDCPEEDDSLVWQVDVDTIAAEYAALAESGGTE